MPHTIGPFTIGHDAIARLLAKAQEIADLREVSEHLNWDSNTYLPPGGEDSRAQQIATLTGVIHDLCSKSSLGECLEDAKSLDEQDLLNEYDQALIRLMERSHRLAVTVPKSLQSQLAESSARGENAWKRARAENKFSLFRDPFARTLDLTRRRAECLRTKDLSSLYDVLLDEYEPGMTTAQLDPIFDSLKRIVGEAIVRIRNSDVVVDDSPLRRLQASKERFDSLTRKILGAMGFDFDRGRLDEAVHPFMSGSHPNDIRITTRYSEPSFMEPFGSAMHEAGHGLYAQGVDPRLARTPLASGASMGLHESQSRFWENHIGKSQAFWDYWYPFLLEELPDYCAGIKNPRHLVAMLRGLKVSPIRLESDQLTYNLHIALRYEIERDFVAGTLSVDDLPSAWNAKVQSYLGIEVKSDTEGVLQDTHWGCGLIGYFPTYSIGNLMAAQFDNALRRDVTPSENVPEWMRAVREWQRTRIHRWGSTYTASEVLKRATGEPLNPKYFEQYIAESYGAVYGF